MSVSQTSLPFKWLELCTGMFAPGKDSSESPLSQAWFKALGMLSEGTRFHRAELALRKVTQQFHAMLPQALRDALMTLDARLAHPPCPDCHRPMWRNRLDSLTIQLLEGEIKFLRWYCECRPCGLHLHPLEVWLNLPDKGECAPRFGKDLCLLAIHLPAQTSVDVLTALTGRRFSRTALRQQIKRDGEALVDLEREEAESPWPWDEKQRIRPIQPLGGPPLRSTPRPGLGCIIELDGVFANLGRDPAILKELEQYEAAKKAAIEAGTSPPKEVPSRFREERLGERPCSRTCSRSRTCRLIETKSRRVTVAAWLAHDESRRVQIPRHGRRDAQPHEPDPRHLVHPSSCPRSIVPHKSDTAARQASSSVPRIGTSGQSWPNLRRM